MDTIPQLSIIKGSTKQLIPNTLNNIIENISLGSAEHKSALIFEENGKTRHHTYGELNKITNQLGRTIQQTIVNNNLPSNLDGDYIVAVNMQPSDHLVMVLLAIWKAGAAYLPLDQAYPGARIEQIVRESKPVLIIYEEDSKFYMDTFKKSFKVLLGESKKQSDISLSNEKRLHHLKDDLAMVVCTSGSSAVPKGVRLLHKVILNRLQWQFERFPYSSTENVCVFKTALIFIDSVSEIWGPLLNGRTLLVVSKILLKDPEKLIEVLDNFKVERLVLVPSFLCSILMCLNMQGNRSKSLQNLNLWICSGETLTVSLAEEFLNQFSGNGHVLCNFYGSTEVMGDVTYEVISDSQQLKQHSKVPIGLPVDNTIIYILDKDFRPIKVGDIGELFVAGLNVAAGYLNGHDSHKFIDNPFATDPTYSKLYRTGDYARIEKGTLIYEGRSDSQVKIRGQNVDLLEVQNAVYAVEGVKKAVVLCYKAGEVKQALLAFVTTDGSTSEYKIENVLKTILTSYMVPQIILIKSIPLLVNGKVDRQALLKSYESSINEDGSFVAYDIDYSGVPNEHMNAAKELFETVASVLGRPAINTISIDANFYEIGGNSGNSIYTMMKLNEQGYHINIRDFISAVNLGEILERMTSTHQIPKECTNYSFEFLNNEHKETVANIVSTSCFQAVDLEHMHISQSDYVDLVDFLWSYLIEQNLSFIARNQHGQIAGVSINFDAHDEPELKITSELSMIFQFLESIEKPIRDLELPKGKGKIFHSFMMSTSTSLTPKENVEVMVFMEKEVLNLAKDRCFLGVFATNTTPLSQQLGSVVNKYETLLDFQVNKYIAKDNTKPFRFAPDNQRAIVQWKSVIE